MEKQRKEAKSLMDIEIPEITSDEVEPKETSISETVSEPKSKFITERMMWEAAEKIKVRTYTGEISLKDYHSVLAFKMKWYKEIGVADIVKKQILQDNASRVKKGKGSRLSPQELSIRLVYALYKLAEMEILYGLQPITHTLPMNEGRDIFVTYEGRMKYASEKGDLEKFEVKVRQVDKVKNRWEAEAWIKRKGLPEIYVKETASGSRTEPDFSWVDPRLMAEIRVRRNALKLAYPLGVGEEEKAAVEQAYEERMEAFESVYGNGTVTATMPPVTVKVETDLSKELNGGKEKGKGNKEAG